MPQRLPVELELLAHPGAAACCVSAVQLRLAATSDGGLALDYRLAHDGRLIVPAPVTSGPADQLWTTTCCELFISPAGDSAYREFNFSPSGQWAIYDFAGYRLAAPAPQLPATPQLHTAQLPGQLQLHARLPASLLPANPAGRPLLLGLSVVSHCPADAGLHYWALRHPGARPDFHDRRSFALNLQLPPPTALQGRP